jgi:hypothetical protein
MKGTTMTNPVEKINSARKGWAPARQGVIDETQYLFDKAARLAREAAEAAQNPVPEEEPAPPAETDAARQARLIAVLKAARAGGAG